ncbi:hypothetical protein [Ornithinibacillus halophilus]|nr:hypothetical protein [Ornithinibacillus halophilus]
MNNTLPHHIKKLKKTVNNGTISLFAFNGFLQYRQQRRNRNEEEAK